MREQGSRCVASDFFRQMSFQAPNVRTKPAVYAAFLLPLFSHSIPDIYSFPQLEFKLRFSPAHCLQAAMHVDSAWCCNASHSASVPLLFTNAVIGNILLHCSNTASLQQKLWDLMILEAASWLMFLGMLKRLAPLSLYEWLLTYRAKGQQRITPSMVVHCPIHYDNLTLQCLVEVCNEILQLFGVTQFSCKNTNTNESIWRFEFQKIMGFMVYINSLISWVLDTFVRNLSFDKNNL